MIDASIRSSDWPAEVRDAVSQFEQGDLVERPPFFYVGSARYGVWSLTHDTGDPDVSEELFELDPRDAPPYGMITTETCDLVEDENPRHPWISIAPVYQLENLDQNQIDLLRTNRVAYMRLLTAARFASQIWVVDARIEIPVEKSWLVGRQPIMAFGTADERSRVGRFLAGRRERPVLGGEVNRSLLTPMRRWIERLSPTKRHQVLDGIAEIRLAVSGDPLSPDGLLLIIIGDSGDVPTAVRTAWDAKWAGWSARLDAVGISLLPNMYSTLDALPTRRYVTSFGVPLDFALS